MTVKSGRCVPPQTVSHQPWDASDERELRTWRIRQYNITRTQIITPIINLPLHRKRHTTNLPTNQLETFTRIEFQHTIAGTCGALATRPPSGEKTVHEKSNLSLILVLTLVFCNALPICSATPMNLCPKIDNWIGSTVFAEISFLDEEWMSSITMLERMLAVASGGTTRVCEESIMRAGPGMRRPGAKVERSWIGVVCQPRDLK